MEFKEVFVKVSIDASISFLIVLFFMEFKEVFVEFQLTHP